MMTLVLAARLVTVAFAPLPLPAALERLSASAGERLECDPALADEVLLVRLKDADRERALREIADLFDARWRRGAGRRTLVSDPEAERRHEARRLVANAATLDGSLAYLGRRLSRKSAPNEEAEETPAWRAAARLVRRLGRPALLSLPHGSRAVWAERPTPTQRAFPEGSAAILADYRRDLGALDPGLRPARVRLAVGRLETGAAFNVALQALDASGETVGSALLTLIGDPEAKPRPFRLRGTKADPSPLPYTPMEREYLTVLGAAGPRKAELMPKWRTLLMDPGANEPTGWYPGARFVAAAQALDRNLIGTPGELPGAAFDPIPDPQTAFEFMARGSGVRERGGWLILEREEGGRASRAAGGRLLADYARRGGADLDSAAAWAGASSAPFPFDDWVGRTVGVLLASGGGWYEASGNLGERDRLRLWDALGAPARQALREGRTVGLAQLPAAGREWVGRTAYWSGGLGDREPTEVLPMGIAGGTVRLAVEEETVIVPAASSAPAWAVGPAMTAERLGLYQALGDSVRGVGADTFRAYDRFRLGTARTYHLIFALGAQGVPMGVDLQETFFDPEKAPVERLPDDLRARVEAARLKATKPTTGQ